MKGFLVSGQHKKDPTLKEESKEEPHSASKHAIAKKKGYKFLANTVQGRQDAHSR